MSRLRVVVLGAPSLFTEGIAARLGEHSDRIELAVVDSREADGLEKAVASRPQVVLFEEGEEGVDGPCPLMDLLVSSPKVRVIRLDASQDQMRVFSSEQRSVREPKDLLNIVLQPE